MKAIELQQKIENGLRVKVLDIRAKEKYDAYHISGAINVIPGKLIANPQAYLTSDQKNYVICNSGNSAGFVVNILKNKGYDIENVKQGMNPLLRDNS